MYVAHLAPALAARRHWPEAGLVLLLLASQMPDWMDAALLSFLPWDRTGVWSHGLPALAGVALFAGTVAVLRPALRRTTLVTAGVWLTHPLFDLVTGIKPTWPGGPWIGLDLYSHPVGDFFLEAALIGMGWWAYRGSLPESRRRHPLLRLLLIGLLACQAGLDAWLAHRS